MSFTRFHDDPSRIAKQLEESTGSGKYILNTPGNGETPYYMEDPYVRMQLWGANLRTNPIEIDNDLKGLTRPLNRDCLNENNYKQHVASSESVEYPSFGMMTEQPRACMPAWTLRGIDTEEYSRDYLFFNPQSNIETPFSNNVASRITAKDEYDKTNKY